MTLTEFLKQKQISNYKIKKHRIMREGIGEVWFIEAEGRNYKVTRENTVEGRWQLYHEDLALLPH